MFLVQKADWLHITNKAGWKMF